MTGNDTSKSEAKTNDNIVICQGTINLSFDLISPFCISLLIIRQRQLFHFSPILPQPHPFWYKVVLQCHSIWRKKTILTMIYYVIIERKKQF